MIDNTCMVICVEDSFTIYSSHTMDRLVSCIILHTGITAYYILVHVHVYYTLACYKHTSY